MMKMIKTLLMGLGSIFLFSVSTIAHTNEYPSSPVKIVVPFPPGGGTDGLGRIVAQGLTEKFGTSFIVENKPGAAGIIGANYVSKSRPDGRTLLMAATGAILPEPGANDYTLTEHFAPIALIAAPPYLLTVSSNVTADSVAELIALGKKQAGALAYASSGIGAASHLAALQFEEKTGIKMLHVPYKGMGQAVTDLISGQIAVMFAPAPAVLSHVQAGKLKVLAVTGAERSPLFPDYPTIQEAGVPGYQSVGWFGLFAPPGTSPAIIETLNRTVNGILQQPDVKKQLETMGATPASTTVQEFTTFIAQDVQQVAKLLQTLER